MDEVVSIQFVTTVALDFHDLDYWPIVGHASVLDFEPVVDLDGRRARGFIGTNILDAGILMNVLDVCFALATWDFHADPEYFDKILLSPDRKPKKLIHKADQPS